MLHLLVPNKVKKSNKTWLETHCYCIIELWGYNEGRWVRFWSVEFVYLLNLVKVFSVPYFNRAVTANRNQAARESWMAGLNHVFLVRPHYYFKRVVFQFKNWQGSVTGHHTYFRFGHVDIATGDLLVDRNFGNQLTEVRTPDLDVALLISTHHKGITIDQWLDRTIVKVNYFHYHAGVKIYHVKKATLSGGVDHLDFWFGVFIQGHFRICEYFAACCVIEADKLARQEIAFDLEEADHATVIDEHLMRFALFFVSFS